MFEKEYEHDRELAADERKLTYSVTIAVLVLLLLALILWQVM